MLNCTYLFHFSVECIYLTEPKATCCPHRNSAKCVLYLPFSDGRGHLNILWGDFLLFLYFWNLLIFGLNFAIYKLRMTCRLGFCTVYTSNAFFFLYLPRERNISCIEYCTVRTYVHAAYYMNDPTGKSFS